MRSDIVEKKGPPVSPVSSNLPGLREKEHMYSSHIALLVVPYSHARVEATERFLKAKHRTRYNSVVPRLVLLVDPI